MCLKIFEYLRRIVRNVTVEPAVFVFAISTGLYWIVSSELYIMKVCKVNFAFGDEICDDLQHHNEEQVVVQKYVSTLKIWNTVLQSIPAAIFTLFVGPWSDKYGRKFLMISSLMGFVIANAIYMINAYWFYELKAEYLLFEAIQDCTGGHVAFFMGAHAYMADLTDPQGNRTKRMGFIAGIWPVGSNIGKALSALIKAKLGFMWVFAMGGLMSFLGGCYVLLFLKNSILIRNERLRKRLEGGESLAEHELEMIKSHDHHHKDADFSKKVKHLFSFTNLKDGYKAITKKRDNNMRTYLFLMIMCMEMETFINVGDWGNAYLFLRRKLQFTLEDFTRYTTVIGFIGIVSQYVWIPIMSEKLKLRDSTITIIDITGCFIQSLLIAFAVGQWMLYLGACIAFLDYSSYATIRSMITKTVRADEIGKVLAFVAAIQAFLPIASSPLFGIIYRSTVEFFPQTFMLVIAGLFAIDWCILVTIDRKLCRNNKLQEQQEQHDKDVQEYLDKTAKPLLIKDEVMSKMKESEV